ncbi:hypothetical protein ABZ370_36745 [Streptomyces sp. NPDC005962]|uniref:hypothetical protein n=1 Tax=Streptomyces sp. NPDC005962 TaxID=3154466 RepID=UPI003411667A
MNNLDKPEELDELYRFSLVENIGDLAEAHALRLVRYEPRFPESDFWWLDKDRDVHGKVFTLHKGDRIGASLRIVPVTACTTEIEELGLLPEDLKGDPSVWELGRLVSVPSRGRDLPYSRLLFGWATQWAKVNLPIQKVVSYCRGGKVSGFEASGAKVVAGPYSVPERGDDYFTIVADLQDVVDRLSGYGFGTLLEAAAAGKTEFSTAEILGSPRVPASSGTNK